jgi:hypothetical protein
MNRMKKLIGINNSSDMAKIMTMVNKCPKRVKNTELDDVKEGFWPQQHPDRSEGCSPGVASQDPPTPRTVGTSRDPRLAGGLTACTQKFSLSGCIQPGLQSHAAGVSPFFPTFPSP